MADGLGGFLSSIGERLGAAGAAGQDPAGFFQKRQQQRLEEEKLRQQQILQQQQQSALAQLPGILTGQNIPAFRREELGSPQAIAQEQRQNVLGALGTLAPQQLTQQAVAQAFPKRVAPVTLKPGEQLVQPTTGELVAQAPETTLQRAQARKTAQQTRKFQFEADKLESQLAAGVGVNDPQVFEQVGKLRREFTNLSKEFITQRDAFSRVQASAEDPSAAGDIALIFNFMKTLDPGSTVREGEFATAQNAAGVPERIRAQLNKVLSGERLVPKTRADFVKRAGLIFDRAQKQHDKRVGTFSTLAVKSGLPSDQVVLDLQLAGEPSQSELEAEALRRGL